MSVSARRAESIEEELEGASGSNKRGHRMGKNGWKSRDGQNPKPAKRQKKAATQE